MSNSLSFLIRDGLESDISACLLLDHHYETDLVWQMTVDEKPGQWHIGFQKQQLPRTLETSYQPDRNKLLLSLPDDQCFLVAATRDSNELMAYLAMQRDPVNGIAQIHDLVVSMPYRRQRIGTRLLGIARQWAKEHGLHTLMFEAATQNYPGIVFAQQSGFKFCGYNDHYFPNQDIAVFFSQALS
ncbi:MAG: GNAT family N-acetyltransferase [Chloroflexi bacterium]|nr:GNAT family N-acetyltransferase [Chloroflexota bacterium]MCC6895646.1 GNAT family N-acetyltransferase [Anaerolineae bacterium]